MGGDCFPGRRRQSRLALGSGLSAVQAEYFLKTVPQTTRHHRISKPSAMSFLFSYVSCSDIIFARVSFSLPPFPPTRETMPARSISPPFTPYYPARVRIANLVAPLTGIVCAAWGRSWRPPRRPSADCVRGKGQNREIDRCRATHPRIRRARLGKNQQNGIYRATN
jgi:hypothetical protein